MHRGDSRRNRHQIDDSDINGQRASPGRAGHLSPDTGLGRGVLAGVLSRSGNTSRQSPHGGSRSGVYSVGGHTSRQGSVRDPNQIAADVDNIQTNSPDAIERERHNTQIRQDLLKTFQEIDADKNGYVDKEELIQYMLKLSGNNKGIMGGQNNIPPEEFLDLQGRFDDVVTTLFERMDKSGDQRVEVNEFVDAFYYEYTTLLEEIEELELRIRD